jgi:hypothetical protein
MNVAPDPGGGGSGEEPGGIKTWFHEQHRRTSYITVSVTMLGLLVTVALGLWNISLQIGRPELEPLYTRLMIAEEGAGWHGLANWRNAGKQSANSVFVTVYVADKDGMRQDKLWAAFCETTKGPPTGIVIPNNPVECDFRLGRVNHPPDHLLMCVAYRSESRKKYRRAFRYRVLPPVLHQTGGQPPQVWTAMLEEEFPRPSEKVCR